MQKEVEDIGERIKKLEKLKEEEEEKIKEIKKEEIRRLDKKICGLITLAVKKAEYSQKALDICNHVALIMEGIDKKREHLESFVEESFDDIQKLANDYEVEYEKNPCRGNQIRNPLSQIRYHNELIEKTIERLDNCDKRFDFSLKGVRNNIGVLWNYKQHKKLKKVIKDELKGYSDKLENYKKEYIELFKSEIPTTDQLEQDRFTSSLLNSKV